MTAPAGSQQSQSLGLVRKISYLLFFWHLKTIIRDVTGLNYLSKLEAKKINAIAYPLFILFLVSLMAISHLLDRLHHFGMGLLWIHRPG